MATTKPVNVIETNVFFQIQTLEPNLHGTEPTPLSAQPACETICAPVTTQHPCADVQDLSAPSSLLMEHNISQDPNSHGTEPTLLSAQPACETICAPVTTQLPSADVQDFSASSSLLMEHTSLDIRRKVVQNPDIIDVSSDSNMSAVFEIQVSTVSSASVHEKKNPTYKQPINLVFVPGVDKKDDGRRIYNKELACLYCGKLLKHRLKNHLATQHSEEEEVASLLAGSKMEQNKGFQLIKNKGNFRHNIKVLEQREGKLIVVRRSTNSSKEDEYLPCIYCMGYFRVEDLWRHCGKCPFSTEEEKI